MFKQLKSRNSLLRPLVILAIVFIAQTFSIFSTQYSQTKSLKKLNTGVVLSIKLSKILHETQKERGLSSGYSGSQGREFTHSLLLQRKKVDKKFNNLLSYLAALEKSNLNKETVNILDKALVSLKTLKHLRRAVDNFSLTNSKVIESYSKINNKILKVMTAILKTTNVPKITNTLQAYDYFLSLKEEIGIERGIGTGLLIQKSINQNNIYKFRSSIAKEELYKSLFIEFSSVQNQHYFRDALDTVMLQKIEKIRKKILEQDYLKGDSLLAIHWFNAMTNKIDRFKTIEDYLAEDITGTINNEITLNKKNLYISIVVSIISIMIFVTMLILILNAIKRENDLKLLLDKYIINSTTDLSGKIISVSEAFCTISGYTKEKLIGSKHNIVRHPEMSKEIFKELWVTLKADKTWSGEVKNLREDGSFYWVYAIITPIYNARGKKIGYSAIRHDINDQKKIEILNSTLEMKVHDEVEKNRQKDKQLMQQSRLAQMGEMISMIAHQWRQPLAAISSTSTALNLRAQINTLNNETTIEMTSKISEFSQHLSSTIDDFREFFKSNKEKIETNYNQLVESTLSIVDTSIENKNIELILNLHNDEPMSTFASEVKQVLLNLIKNAEDILVDNRVENPKITITADMDGITVADNGGGVPESIVDKIFDPYFSTKMAKDGTGLGLYMSKTIIEDHCGGILSVENNEYGAVFRIKLD